jgi:hypothetical protein
MGDFNLLNIMTVTINQHKELKWKLKDGTLKPIKDLSNEELQAFRKIAKRNAETFYQKFEFFGSLLEEMDDELQNRINELKAKIQHLEKIEESA